MILTGKEIEKQHKEGKIKISPFNPKQITTNSYDLKLGTKYLRYTGKEIDLKKAPEYEIHDIPEDGLHLKKGDFILAETAEKFGSDHFVPIIHAKSGTARAGLFVHITADLIDLGSYGKSTLQLFATIPIVLYPKSLIAQVTFWKPLGEISLYDGKYQNSDGPMPTQIWRDFNKS